MTPVERLQAAIATLTDFTGEDWHASTYINGVTDIEATNPGGGRRVITDLFLSDDAHLIVTLHRTIDAQLQILQHALARAKAKIAGGGVAHAVWSHERDALALSDAILNTPALAEGADPKTPDSEEAPQ
ncbi:hypothetical protein [Microcella sp.]|uniref:hypothetical protein n=1 Tax=Microcella sp. TaxID=1913979 RepID=UPI00391B3A71